MQLTILPADNMVVIDGRAARVDLSRHSKLLEGVHAVKWEEVLGYGHIEYDQTTSPHPAIFIGTVRITDLKPYQAIIDAHRSATAKQDAELEKANAANNNPK